ncbi:alanine/glycine:cation symporter family protein [Haloimpatiens sp. FM7330]|uniref:alanine/glycine:cation symporter family protein n=1 Tax=Haloimpatiens sp. FM7330 TaxID=3298610 RepID=UPI003627B0DC
MKEGLYLLNFFESINGFLWNYFLIFALCGTGIFLTISFKGIQITKFGRAFKKVFSSISIKGKRANEDGMSSFQALATAVASQVGAGNLAGAATAITSGGPGAIFWMWLSGFFGMSTIFSEAVLAQIYKKKVNGHMVGGPAFYIRDGLKKPVLAMFFAVGYIIFGLFDNTVQANSLGKAFIKAWNVPSIVIGLIIGILAAIVFIGGIGRIASLCEKVVPLMALMYIIGAIIIVVMNASNIGLAFKMIFVCAFSPRAAAGGFLGASVKQAVRYGVARGLYSNEAGMGTTPHAHAVAKVKHPVQQGLSAIIGLFIDTFVILTLTAIIILVTGAADGNITGIELTQNAFKSVFGNAGLYFIAVALFFFCFTTIISIYFFGECNFRYLFKGKGLIIYKILMFCIIVIGPSLEVQMVWEFMDTFNAIIIIPNLIALLGLVGVVKKSIKDYNEKFEKKAVSKSNDINM